jgi:hypothetical protein
MSGSPTTRLPDPEQVGRLAGCVIGNVAMVGAPHVPCEMSALHGRLV